MVQSEAVSPGPREARFKSDRPLAWKPRHVESIALFVLAFAGYLALGWYTTIHLNVVVGDAEARLSHAYDVFWNNPPKLAAIGFVWPPLMTLVFLPFALIKPLATSLWALPLASALFGAALVVTLCRALRGVGMPRWQRLTLVGLFGIDPMIAAYASNGMAEIFGLWFLTMAVVAFVRWYSDRLPRQLVVVGIFMMLATIMRYELSLWLMVLLPAIGLMIGRNDRSVEFEASVIAVVAPVFYALGVWTLLNWTILGDPIAWLHQETSLTFTATRAATSFGLLDVVGTVVRENAMLFPLSFVVVALLARLAVRRRDPMAATLAAVIAFNAVITVAITLATQSPQLYQLRYNTRTMPLVIVGVAWLYRQAAARWARETLWFLAVACLVVTIPVTWHMMKTYRYQFDERAFVQALETGRDQSRNVSGVDPLSDRAMARYIVSHVRTNGAVLTDDTQTFGILLASGRPGLFFDRIDENDARWAEVARQPHGKVRYLLLSDSDLDLLTRIYHRAYTAGEGRGLRLVFEARRSKLFEVETH